MFQSAVSPIRDMRGDSTINVVSTPHFPASPLLEPKSDVCRRLFENSSVESCPDGCRCQVCHYADLYGYDSWTTDSLSNGASLSNGGAFRESKKSCPDGCRCQVCHYADLYGYDSWTTDSQAECEEPENEFRWSATP